MRYITKKTSETSKKFNEIEKRKKEVFGEVDIILNELGITQYRGGYWVAFGGISSLCYPKDKAVPSFMKKIRDDEYMPKKNTIEGKKLNEKIVKLPTISYNELNSCIGFKAERFECIGYDCRHPEYYIFDVKEEWDVNAPSDCEEILFSKYKELMNEIGDLGYDV